MRAPLYHARGWVGAALLPGVAVVVGGAVRLRAVGPGRVEDVGRVGAGAVHRVLDPRSRPVVGRDVAAEGGAVDPDRDLVVAVDGEPVVLGALDDGLGDHVAIGDRR